VLVGRRLSELYRHELRELGLGPRARGNLRPGEYRGQVHLRCERAGMHRRLNGVFVCRGRDTGAGRHGFELQRRGRGESRIDALLLSVTDRLGSMTRARVNGRIRLAVRA